MSEFDRPKSKKNQRRVANVQSVISGFEAMPQHTPEVLPEIDYTYHPFQHDVEDTNLGFDSEGNYHHPSLRTEHVGRTTT